MVDCYATTTTATDFHRRDHFEAEIARLKATLAAKEAECEALRGEVEKWTADFRYQFDRAEAAEAKLKRIRAETIEECARVAGAYIAICENAGREYRKLPDALRDLAYEDSAE